MQLTASRARELLRYDPDTGLLSRVKNGRKAGGPDKDGYIRITVDGRRYRAARLIWLMVTGAWPAAEVDHRNTIRNDDSWDNLREGTHAQNLRNNRGWSKIGLPKGVRPNGKGWAAKISVNGRNRYLGHFHSIEEAHAAYVAAAHKLVGEFANAGHVRAGDDVGKGF